MAISGLAKAERETEMMATTREDAAVLPLQQVEAATAFEGFEPEDFAVFTAPDLDERMPLLRQRITPKLKLLAAGLRDRMSDVAEETMFPHVALHLRRSVNPPVETWAAFARNARAYKPFVHYRAGLSVDKFKVTVFVEDYADDKLLFARNLARNASGIAAWCKAHPTIHAYDIPDRNGEPSSGHNLTAAALRRFATRLQNVKGQHARFAIAFDKSHPVVGSGPQCIDTVLEAARQLRPLYDCGRPNFRYVFTPEEIRV